jgi:hypothetical protein
MMPRGHVFYYEQIVINLLTGIKKELPSIIKLVKGVVVGSRPWGYVDNFILPAGEPLICHSRGHANPTYAVLLIFILPFLSTGSLGWNCRVYPHFPQVYPLFLYLATLKNYPPYMGGSRQLEIGDFG